MPAVELLLHSLSQRDDLSDSEKSILLRLPRVERKFRRGQTIVASRSEEPFSNLLLRGLAGREVMLADGGRQFTTLNIPGDFLDLHSFVSKRLDHGAVALTDCVTQQIAHSALRQISDQSAHLTRLLWLMTATEAAIERQWIASMGRRDALQRLAHFFCDLHHRLEAAGLATEPSIDLPLSQSVLADMLGLSLVHINRTVQGLRAKGLISWQRGQLSIRDFKRLSALADFDPAYLNLVRQPR